MAAHFNGTGPTRTRETEAGYLRRYQQMQASLVKATGRADLSPEEVVGHLLNTKENFSMSYWRYQKNAVLYVMNTRFP